MGSKLHNRSIAMTRMTINESESKNIQSAYKTALNASSHKKRVQQYNNAMAKMSIPTICEDKEFCQDAPFLPLDTGLLSASQWINRSQLRGEIIRLKLRIMAQLCFLDVNTTHILLLIKQLFLFSMI